MTKLNSGIAAFALLAAAILLLPATSIAAVRPDKWPKSVKMPEPSSLPMLITGLAGLGGLGWRFRRSGK
ncbi:MAG: PEP-CTERM sorting domain-containing protein [Candidatus Acidiferrales bacterium]